MNRTTHDSTRYIHAEHGARFSAKICKDAADQIFERVPASEDLRAVQSTDGKVAFQRLDQTTRPFDLRGMTVQVALNCCRASERLGPASACCLMLFKVEQGSKGRCA